MSWLLKVALCYLDLFCQGNTDDILHSVFRTDNNEECWKLTTVKNEVAEDSVSLDETAEHDDSDGDQRYSS